MKTIFTLVVLLGLPFAALCQTDAAARAPESRPLPDNAFRGNASDSLRGSYQSPEVRLGVVVTNPNIGTSPDGTERQQAPVAQPANAPDQRAVAPRQQSPAPQQ